MMPACKGRASFPRDCGQRQESVSQVISQPFYGRGPLWHPAGARTRFLRSVSICPYSSTRYRNDETGRSAYDPRGRLNAETCRLHVTLVVETILRIRGLCRAPHEPRKVKIVSTHRIQVLYRLVSFHSLALTPIVFRLDSVKLAELVCPVALAR